MISSFTDYHVTASFRKRRMKRNTSPRLQIDVRLHLFQDKFRRSKRRELYIISTIGANEYHILHPEDETKKKLFAHHCSHTDTVRTKSSPDVS